MADKTPRSGHAPVNGLQLRYEIYGAGEPLVLLSGGLGKSGMFGELLPMLAQGRQVIAVDLRAHGRTADIDRPMPYDIAALLAHLEIAQADVMGYSLGGGVTTARRELAIAGYTQLAQLTAVSEAELLRLHGVGPKAIRLLREALAAQGLAFAKQDA